MVKRTFQNWLSSKLALSSGIKLAIIIIARYDKFIIMLVEVPNPLSINQLGTTSLRAVGVAHKMTPQVNPNSSLPMQIA